MKIKTKRTIIKIDQVLTKLWYYNPRVRVGKIVILSTVLSLLTLVMYCFSIYWPKVVDYLNWVIWGIK